MKNKNFYLLYGEDKAVLNKEVDNIKNKLKITEDDITYYNIEDINNIIEEAQTISMFSPNKFIIIDSSIYLSEKKDIQNINLLEEYFEHYNSNSYLIFISNKDTIDSRKKLVKIITSKYYLKNILFKTI